MLLLPVPAIQAPFRQADSASQSADALQLPHALPKQAWNRSGHSVSLVHVKPGTGVVVVVPGVPDARQAPFVQAPSEHSVPFAFGLSLPFLHVFLPFFRSHLPFLQVWHSLGFGLHLPDLAASASSALKSTPAMAATASTASPRRACRRVSRFM